MVFPYTSFELGLLEDIIKIVFISETEMENNVYVIDWELNETCWAVILLVNIILVNIIFPVRTAFCQKKSYFRSRHYLFYNLFLYY